MDKFDETLIHLFCDCDKITPLWDNLCDFTGNKTGENFQFSQFQKMFGLDTEDYDHKNTINFLILCMKFYIYRCKFQKVTLNFQAYKTWSRSNLIRSTKLLRT